MRLDASGRMSNPAGSDVVYAIINSFSSPLYTTATLASSRPMTKPVSAVVVVLFAATLMMASSTARFSTFRKVVFPDTVRLPPTTRSLDVVIFLACTSPYTWKSMSFVGSGVRVAPSMLSVLWATMNSVALPS